MKGIINAFGKIKTTTVLMTIAAICAVLLVAFGSFGIGENNTGTG